MRNRFNDFGDDFFGRWDEFNNIFNNSSFFKSEMQELLKMLLMSREFNEPLEFRIVPLNVNKRKETEEFEIPENEMDIENGEDENGKWETKHWSSPDGSVSWTSFSRSTTPEEFFNSEIMGDLVSNYRNRKAQKYSSEDIKNFKLEKLQKSLESAVKVENYEKAAEIKKLIDRIKEEKPDNKK